MFPLADVNSQPGNRQLQARFSHRHGEHRFLTDDVGKGTSAAASWHWSERFREAALGIVHKATSVAIDAGIEGEQTGAPEAHVTTLRASAAHLVEELLSHKMLTKEVRIKPVQGGMIDQGRLYDLFLEKAEVGPETRIDVYSNGTVGFVVANLSVSVTTKYDLRLTSMDLGESGEVKARLFGSGMTLRFPLQGTGLGGCDFGEGLDLDVIQATSSHDAINVAIGHVLQSNLMGIRTEVVEGMEDGLCKALLDDNLEGTRQLASGVVGDLAVAEPMWPLVVLGFALMIGLLGLCFWIGWLSGKKSKVATSRSIELESKVSEDQESGYSWTDEDSDASSEHAELSHLAKSKTPAGLLSVSSKSTALPSLISTAKSTLSYPTAPVVYTRNSANAPLRTVLLAPYFGSSISTAVPVSGQK